MEAAGERQTGVRRDRVDDVRRPIHTLMSNLLYLMLLITETK